MTRLFDPVVGALLSWIVATVTIALSAAGAARAKQRIYPKSLARLFFVASVVLIYIAIDVNRSFPYLSTDFGTLLDIHSGNPVIQDLLEGSSLSSLMLVVIAVFGIAIALILKGDTEDEEEERAGDEAPKSILKGFGMMTLLPIVVQFWVLVAATDRLENLSGILTTGLFILSGPAAWQFAALAMITSDRKRSRFLELIGIMGISLVSALLATLIGLNLRAWNTQVEGQVLQHLASFTLLLVPYLLFFSYKGDIWQEERAVAAIVGLVVFAVFSSINIVEPLLGLIAGLGIWMLLVFLPDILFPSANWAWTLECSNCRERARGVLYKEIKKCLNCNRPFETLKELVEDRKSIYGFFCMAIAGLTIRPEDKDLDVEITPKKEEYSLGEQISLVVSVLNRDRKKNQWPVQCKTDFSWRDGKRWRKVSESENFLIPYKERNSWSLNVAIPASKGSFGSKKRRIKFRVRAYFTETKFPGYYTRGIPFAQPAKKICELPLAR